MNIKNKIIFNCLQNTKPHKHIAYLKIKKNYKNYEEFLNVPHTLQNK